MSVVHFQYVSLLNSRQEDATPARCEPEHSTLIAYQGCFGWRRKVIPAGAAPEQC